MNNNILIRTINENEWEEAMNLAWDTFILYEAPEYTKEGITSFRNFVRDPILKTLFIEGKYNVLAAFNNNIIVGIIGVRNETHISLLFVDSEYHKKGIARRLVEKTFERTYEKYGKREMTVNSSPYAVGFYHKMGFVDTDIEQTTDGIRYTPMKARF